MFLVGAFVASLAVYLGPILQPLDSHPLACWTFAELACLLRAWKRAIHLFRIGFNSPGVRDFGVLFCFFGLFLDFCGGLSFWRWRLLIYNS